MTRKRLPRIVHPMLATLVDKPFDDERWAFEIKWDGVRAIAALHEDGSVELYSRNGHDLLGQFPEFATLQRAFRPLPAILDGEIVSLDRFGRSSFQRLQKRLGRHPGGAAEVDGAGTIAYAVFDALYAGGKDLRGLPLERRRTTLEKGLKAHPRVFISKQVRGSGRRLFAVARKRHLEGIIAKLLASTYQPRRSRDWLKIKTVLEQECVICGWTDPRGSRARFGALVLGLYAGGKLQLVGAAGTGFDRALLDDVWKRLQPLASARAPFATVPRIAGVHWVRPKLVAEVRVAEWTRDKRMRQPVFLGLRFDKSPRECVFESTQRAR